MRPATFAAIVCSCFVASLAQGDERGAARAHYEKGTTLFDLQRYAEAAKEYEAAYEAKPDPVFLFDIGQAWRLAGEPEKALGAYRSYLRRIVKAPNHDKVEALIGELEKTIQERKEKQEKEAAALAEKQKAEAAAAAAAATPPPPPVVAAPPPAIVAPAPIAPAPMQPHSRALVIAGIVTATLGVAALATGVAFTLLAQSDFNEINSPSMNYVFNPSTESAMKLDQPIGGALLGIGAAAVVAGGTMAFVGARHERSTVSIAPILNRQQAGAALGFTF